MKRAGLFFALALFAFGCNKAADESSKDAGKAPETTSKSGESGGGTSAGGGFAGVQAIFTSKCIGCHGENGKDGVDLRTYESTMKGSHDGPIVTAGDPANSVIVRAVKGVGMDRMPKMGSPLSDAEIVQIETWIKDGAKN